MLSQTIPFASTKADTPASHKPIITKEMRKNILKLTEEERKRFKLTRLSLHNEYDDISDNSLLDYDIPLSPNGIHTNLASLAKSPDQDNFDNDFDILVPTEKPTDPVKLPIVPTTAVEDLRSLATPKPVLPPVLAVSLANIVGTSKLSTSTSHPLGRSDCLLTRPIHTFDCPATPSYPFGRSGYKDPRFNRKQSEYESRSLHYDRDRGYKHDSGDNRSNSFSNYSKRSTEKSNSSTVDTTFKKTRQVRQIVNDSDSGDAEIESKHEENKINNKEQPNKSKSIPKTNFSKVILKKQNYFEEPTIDKESDKHTKEKLIVESDVSSAEKVLRKTLEDDKCFDSDMFTHDIDKHFSGPKPANDSCNAEMEKNMGENYNQEIYTVSDTADYSEKLSNNSKEITKQTLKDIGMHNKLDSTTNVISTFPIATSSEKQNTKGSIITQTENASTTVSQLSSCDEKLNSNDEFQSSDLNQMAHDGVKLNDDILITPDKEYLALDSMIVQSNHLSNKSKESLPDSTIEIHRKVSSEVTSALNDTEGHSKESIEQPASCKKVSVLESFDRVMSSSHYEANIKEFLLWLGKKWGVTEKIKKSFESSFKDYRNQLLEKHMEKNMENTIEESRGSMRSSIDAPSERTESPRSYIAVQRSSDLISTNVDPPISGDSESPFPVIKNVVSPGDRQDVEPPRLSPVYPSTSAEFVEPQPVKPFQYEEVQAAVMSKKDRKVLDAMLEEKALVKVFKCAGRFCSFASDCVESALIHLNTHEHLDGKGYLDCAYCNFDATGIVIQLVIHVFEVHGSCQYSCALCFYRAAADQLVGAHFEKAHGISERPPRVLLVPNFSLPLESLRDDTTGILHRKKAVPYYICNHGNGICKFRTQTCKKYRGHMQRKHATAESHPCYICEVTTPTPTALLKHLTDHGLKLYQCTWCVYGANNGKEMLSHAATMHPTKNPQAYLRDIMHDDNVFSSNKLPIICLSKLIDPIEIVTQDGKNYNPDQEAERAIQPEEIISSPSTSRTAIAPDNTGTYKTAAEIIAELEDITDVTTVQPPPEPMPIDPPHNLANIETEDEDMSLEELCQKYGQFCEPNGVSYKCPVCKSVSEATREAMQSHLLEELVCGRRGIMEPTELPVNQNIEKWVLELLNHQASAIEKTKANLLAHSTNNVVEEPVPGPSGIVVAPSVKSVRDFTESDLEEEFGVFGASKDDCYCCPKCDANFNSEEDIRKHLENELSKIRWRCTKCTDMFSLFHEAQFHDKSHPGPSARPIEAVRDPAVRAAWVNSLVNKQKKSIKRAVEEASPLQDFINLPGMSDNSLLVATHERPASADNLRGHPSQRVSRKRPANSKSNDRVIYGQASKKISGRKCPHCNFVSRSTHYKKSLKEHILRHFRLGVASCLYCDLSSSREVMRHHMENNHSDRPIRWKQTEIPNCLPSLIKIRTRKVVNKKTTVCLHCEKSIPLKYKNTHKHGNKASVFKQKGDVVAKCCICLTLCPDIGAMHEHFKNFHNDNVKVNMANYKLQVDKRELHSCGICQERFTFVRDLYLHHTDRHASKKLTYTTVPFRHDEDDHETRKRKLEEAGPAEMPVAKKSTSLNSFSNSIGIQDDVIIVIDSDSEIE